ncbi:hypothetical protein QYM36_002471 [Artemia franciscana]|uniref:Integrator complex subunit 14 C-terminal domain-containing protein n=1 Tax=Artemia franciscana TaxID=6661 RepID=A0AA88I7U7_ARTSF|nr:hypothetical protein QYM36_002471 [Artemia franciscana]
MSIVFIVPLVNAYSHLIMNSCPSQEISLTYGLFVVPGDALKSEASTDEDLSIDEGKIPSFCVLLHAYLKVGFLSDFMPLLFLQTWRSATVVRSASKRSNFLRKQGSLLLMCIEGISDSPMTSKQFRSRHVGSKSVPRYVDMNLLGPLSDLPSLENPSFPVRPSEKRSYATNVVTWSRPGSLQADVQKVVRHARKLPEKRHNFYKILMEKKKIFTGSLASLLEREGQILRGSDHPEASLELGHAVQQLKSPSGKDRHTSIESMLPATHINNK